jgi:hypothetical protein
LSEEEKSAARFAMAQKRKMEKIEEARVVAAEKAALEAQE